MIFEAESVRMLPRYIWSPRKGCPGGREINAPIALQQKYHGRVKTACIGGTSVSDH